MSRISQLVSNIIKKKKNSSIFKRSLLELNKLLFILWSGEFNAIANILDSLPIQSIEFYLNNTWNFIYFRVKNLQFNINNEIKLHKINNTLLLDRNLMKHKIHFSLNFESHPLNWNIHNELMTIQHFEFSSFNKDIFFFFPKKIIRY